MTTGPSDASDPDVSPTTGVSGAAAAPAVAVETDSGGWFDTGGAPVAPFDVAVIGAGPAGLAASVAAVDATFEFVVRAARSSRPLIAAFTLVIAALSATR